MNRTNQSISALVLVTVVLALPACATRQQTGQVLGGVAGAAAGSQVGGGTGRTIATIGGAVLGAAIGGAIGQNMDDADRRRIGSTLENGRTGESTRWVNPDTGYRYDVQPTRTFDTASGPCREYTMVAEIDGRNEIINGTACRQSDGTWR